MTNITLSINDDVYKKMKGFSDIRWSEFVRKCIQKRIDQLQKIEIADWKNLECLADEKVLFESWLSDEDERAFEYLQ